MYTEILFNPIIKYIFLFMLSYMFFSKLELPHNHIVALIIFIIISNVVFDILMFDEYVRLLKHDENELSTI